MFTIFKEKLNIGLLRTFLAVTAFGFFLCSNHLISGHHTNSFFGTVSSKTSQESHPKDLNECIDEYVYQYGNRGCVVGDLSISSDRSLFSDNFFLYAFNSYLPNNFQIKSPKTEPLHILHSVIQV